VPDTTPEVPKSEPKYVERANTDDENEKLGDEVTEVRIIESPEESLTPAQVASFGERVMDLHEGIMESEK
jgi:hypothetical protein